MEVPKAVLDMYSNPESDRYDLDKYEELKNSYAFVSSALYGLGHSPRAFHQHLDKWFRDNGWQALETDSCAYIKLNAAGQHVVAMCEDGDQIAVPAGASWQLYQLNSDAYPTCDKTAFAVIQQHKPECRLPSCDVGS